MGELPETQRVLANNEGTNADIDLNVWAIVEWGKSFGYLWWVQTAVVSKVERVQNFCSNAGMRKHRIK